VIPVFQDPDSYNAAMMVVADEMVREAEDELKMVDSLVSGGMTVICTLILLSFEMWQQENCRIGKFLFEVKKRLRSRKFPILTHHLRNKLCNSFFSL